MTFLSCFLFENAIINAFAIYLQYIIYDRVMDNKSRRKYKKCVWIIFNWKKKTYIILALSLKIRHQTSYFLQMH